jgi:hypothetical protein
MSINNLFIRLKSIWSPAMFQGWGRKKNYFEGWYFKIVTADESHAYGIIPGIALSKNDSHSFIQVIDGVQKKSAYHRFTLSEFVPNRSRFQISLEENQFALEGLKLSLPEISGVIEFKESKPYRGSFFSPGIMGWYSFMPFMQCYHGLVSVNHEIKGILQINGQDVDFTGGKGYIEKDWGSSFPRAWVWTQCNNYDIGEDLSIMASVAHIPWLGTHFIGFLAIVYHKDEMKIFTTYTHAKMQLKLSDSVVEMTFWDKTSKLILKASQAEGTDLLAPHQGSMIGRVNESLMAEHQVTFLHQGRELSAIGHMAGLEVGGNSLILLNQI